MMHQQQIEKWIFKYVGEQLLREKLLTKGQDFDEKSVTDYISKESNNVRAYKSTKIWINGYIEAQRIKSNKCFPQWILKMCDTINKKNENEMIKNLMKKPKQLLSDINKQTIKFKKIKFIW